MSDSKQQPNWQKALDALASEGSGAFFFLKQPKTQIRLVNLEQDPEHFFLPVTSIYRGQPKTKYIVFGVVLKTQGKELSEKYQNAIVPIVFNKTTIKGILSLLAEGYELFDPAEGYGITIMKSGTGLDTDFNLMPSPHAVPMDMTKLKQPEKTLEDFAAEFSNRQQSRASGGGGKSGEDESGW